MITVQQTRKKTRRVRFMAIPLALVVTAFLSVLVAPWAQAGLPEPRLKVELRKAEDSVRITSTASAAVVTIDSRSGIGGAKLIRTGPAWPARLTIRLKLKGLESFAMENGIIRSSTSYKSPARMPYWKVGKNGERAETADGTLEIIITVTDEAIEIGVPGEMMDGNPEEIRFNWIDFYRN